MFHPNLIDDIVGAEGFARIGIRKGKRFLSELLPDGLGKITNPI